MPFPTLQFFYNLIIHLKNVIFRKSAIRFLKVHSYLETNLDFHRIFFCFLQDRLISFCFFHISAKASVEEEVRQTCMNVITIVFSDVWVFTSSRRFYCCLLPINSMVYGILMFFLCAIDPHKEHFFICYIVLSLLGLSHVFLISFEQKE